MGQVSPLIRRPASRRLRVPSFLVLVPSLAAGCPDPKVPPPPDALTDAAAVLELAGRAGRGIEEAAIEARASLYSDDGARKGKMTLLLRRPASLQVSAWSPTDDLLAILASDGERFTWFERGEGDCHVGRSCPENVGRLLPLAMEGRDVVDLLLGVAPVVRHHERSVTWDRRAGAYLLTLVGDGVRERIWVAHGSGDVKRAVLERGGTRDFEVSFDDHRESSGRRMPHEVSVKARRGNVDLKLVYREVTFGGPLGEDVFRVPCPDGTRVETLPCPGEEGATSGSLE